MRDANVMRTTLDIDDDVLLAVRDLSRQRREPAGRLLSELARRSLLSKAKTGTRDGVPLFPVKPGSPVVTLELVNRLRDEVL
jgi:hypothetical protein